MIKFTKKSVWAKSGIDGMFVSPLGSAIRFDGSIEQFIREANYAFREGLLCGLELAKKAIEESKHF